MRFSLIIILLFAASCTWFGCKEKVKQPDLNYRTQMLLELKDASQKQNSDLKSNLKFWKSQLTNPKYSSDSVLLSKIHYNIAGVYYAMSEIDSIKSQMQLAWLYMEKQDGYEADKAQLYNGLGNIAHLEQKLHQENYYYNRAAEILSADTSLKLSPKQKITVYFSAAQSSAQLRQFDNAFKLNQKAMAILPALAYNPKDSFRAYSQMASAYSSSDKNPDSLYHYIKKMEQVFAQHPDEEKKMFIYDRKASYFTNTERLDSALVYSRKRLAMNLADVDEEGPFASSVLTGNLYMSHVDLASVFVALKQLDSAKFHLNAAEAFAKQYPKYIDDDRLILFEKTRVAYFFATKNYIAAENEQDVLTQRTKFLYETENARAVAEMGALFQLQAKDKSINELNETVVLAEAKLQSNRLWLAVSVLGLLLAVALALLLYFIQRQRKLKTETEKVQLEQRLLRAQMEPHFIFNTLSALQSFIRFNDNAKALKYLQQFGRLLRTSLQTSRESSIKLSEEIETLSNYLSLQQMRYDDAFNYEVTVNDNEDVESIDIPPMLIQPFVENAILHGINPNGNDGEITVDFDVRPEMLIVTIKDNGRGAAQTKKPASHQSLSTTITKERLAILAKERGSAASVDIGIDEIKGTTVVISIPIK